MTQEELHKHMTFGLCTYKTGTGALGRLCGDLGTRDEGLGDIKYGTRGRVGWGRGTSNTGTRGTQGR